ncbi:hypothetical protein HanIR_Chr03g0103991 [Helianthus annuus]|nr:hypothetical protein HanIR_Chr03g0103991 [Helianthus annuus]
MLKPTPSRHATEPRATRARLFPDINRRVWDLISGVGSTYKFVLCTEISSVYYKNTHDHEMLLRYRVLTRSLLRFNIRSIETIRQMFKCFSNWVYTLLFVVIPTGCLSVARTQAILCHSLRIHWMFKYCTLSFVVRILIS